MSSVEIRREWSSKPCFECGKMLRRRWFEWKGRKYHETCRRDLAQKWICHYGYMKHKKLIDSEIEIFEERKLKTYIFHRDTSLMYDRLSEVRDYYDDITLECGGKCVPLIEKAHRQLDIILGELHDELSCMKCNERIDVNSVVKTHPCDHKLCKPCYVARDFDRCPLCGEKVKECPTPMVIPPQE